MPPDFKPALWRFPALDDHRREDDASPLPDNQVAELIVVSQKISEGLETANGFEALTRRGHHRAESEIQRLEALCLEYLAPEIGINGDGLELHCERDRVVEAVKTVHQANT